MTYLSLKLMHCFGLIKITCEKYSILNFTQTLRKFLNAEKVVEFGESKICDFSQPVLFSTSQKTDFKWHNLQSKFKIKVSKILNSFCIEMVTKKNVQIVSYQKRQN